MKKNKPYKLALKSNEIQQSNAKAGINPANFRCRENLDDFLTRTNPKWLEFKRNRGL